jgi:hypothetical protein
MCLLGKMELPVVRLADVKLRGSKNIAHKSFDKIWKEGLKTRDELYEDLSIYLRLPPELTHIGMFQSFTCYKVKDWADKLYFKLKEKEYAKSLQNN